MFDDFNFMPDMNGDGDHDMIDFMILDMILSEAENCEEEEDEDDRCDEHDEE